MQEKIQKTALGYIRISDKKQIEGESPANQRRFIQKYGDDNNIKIIDWFYDEAKTGKNTDRDELQNMLRLGMRKKGQIDYIIVYKMSRASRNLSTYMITIESALERTGINIRSATEAFDESPMGKFVKHLHVMTAELENDTKREMVVDNMRALTVQGYWLHRPPRGYNRHFVKNADGKRRTTIIANHEAEKIENALMRWNRGDMTESKLIRYCTSIGLLGFSGGPIKQEVLHRMIINPAYAGYVCCKLTDFKRVEGVHKGLITPDRFEQNLLILKMKSKDYLIGLKHHETNKFFPLRRFVRCAQCGKYMTAGRPHNSPRYYCHRHSCAQSGSIMTSVLHKQFEELLSAITPTQGTIRLLKELLKRQVKQELGGINQEISRIRSALDANDAFKQKVLNKFITDKISEGEKDSAMTGVETERLSLHTELVDLEQRQMVSESNIDLAINFMTDIRKCWSSAPLELKQAYQELVFPNGFEYHVKGRNFLTPDISPLYRLDLAKVGAKNDKNFALVTLEVSLFNSIVAEVVRWNDAIRNISLQSNLLQVN